MNLYNGPLVEFKSVPKERITQKVSQGCQSDISTNVDAATSSRDNVVSVAVQCGIDSKKATAVDQSSLQQFLRRIYPRLQHELAHPTPLPVDFDSPDSTQKAISLQRISSIQITDQYQDERRLLTAWLSTNPFLLALSFTPKLHDCCACDHALEQILILAEKTESPTRIPIRACASILYASDQVKNILVAGTILGDLYVWKLKRAQRGYTYEESFYKSGHYGMITTLSWLPSENEKTLLIGGHLHGIDTWIYDERYGRMENGRSYTTDQSVGLNPALIIETMSGTSFCLYRRGDSPTIFDLKNCTKAAMLMSGKECKDIDPSLEIVGMTYQFVRNQLAILSKQGDIFIVKCPNGIPETVSCLYRVPHINLRQMVLLNEIHVLCLNHNGSVELIDTTTGKSFSFGDGISHISASTNSTMLTYREEGRVLDVSSVLTE